MVELNEDKKLILLWITRSFRERSISLTQAIARRYGSQVGFVYVGGYPKSGTTWMSRLVAHYLDLPLIEPTPLLPLTFRCVVHHHWNYHPSFDGSIYVMRDGRDVMVSLYMTIMRDHHARCAALTKAGRSPFVRALVKNFGRYNAPSRRLHHLFGRGFDPWDVERTLPVFVEAEMKKPFLGAVDRPWPEHVRMWRTKAQDTIFVKYEDMLQDSLATLSNVLVEYTDADVNEGDILYTVERFSFKKQTGRDPGTEDRKSFARKGVQGDWRNYFTREARQVFDYYAGEMLIELGYETDRQWVYEE